VYGEVGTVIYKDDPNSLEQIGFQLRNLLDKKMDNKNTANWIYSSLAKVKSCAGFEDTFIGDIFNEAKTNQNYEIRQRAHEYSKRSNGIVGITKVEKYDANMTFLKDFIEAAIIKGAKKYEPSK